MPLAFGFLCPYNEYNPTENDFHKESIEHYVSYLAAMHCWSENGGEEFSIINKEWVNQEGDACPYEWRVKICRRDREKLGLDYTLYVIDLDEIDDSFLKGGTDGSLILSPTLMDRLLTLAEGQEEQIDTHNIILFNRPIWLPKRILWKESDGFCHIYGLTAEQGICQELLKETLLYLGYLAMIEELILNGVTPSGFTADVEKNGYLWYNQGEEYQVNSAEVEAECRLCRKKHNLKLRGVIEAVPDDDLIDGVKDGFIISKALYEQLLDNCLD